MSAALRIHHLNCGAMRPPGGAIWDGRTPGLGRANVICHCLLLETTDGLVLVDTGTVGRDVEASAERVGRLAVSANLVRLDPAEAAFNQIARLGHDPGQVKHVVMTHLDVDHACGLPDFPGANVHISAVEARAARNPATRKERARYRSVADADTSRWRLYSTFPSDFFGLPATYLEGIPGVALVWLPGHTRGHCGVAVDLGQGRWLLHAGDAIFNAHELASPPSMPTGARMLQWMMQASQRQRRRSLAALRRIARGQGDYVHIICTHDPALFPADPATAGSAPG